MKTVDHKYWLGFFSGMLLVSLAILFYCMTPTTYAAKPAETTKPAAVETAKPAKIAPFKDEDFQEVVLKGRGTFLRYTGPGQLLWLSQGEPIDSKGLIENVKKPK
jgi:hypothetical protein